MQENDFLAIIREGLGRYPLNRAIAETLKFTLSNKFESMAIVNAQGEIEFLDRLSERLFNITHGEAKGRNILDVIPASELPVVIEQGRIHLGKLFKARGQNRIVSRFPLMSDDKIIGAFGRIILHSLEELERVRHEASRLRARAIVAEKRVAEEHATNYTFKDILGKSARMRETIKLARKMAESDVDILIHGESGTGKELFAHAIHDASPRNSKPFVRVNCPAIPVELAESELFGHEKGAFTGASPAGKPGRFESARGGTIFLDEIGCLPISIQVKLLRVVQEKEVQRLGSDKLLKLDFRVIAATNSDLLQLAEQGQFRHDLYYRLSRVVLNTPPLRERSEDIPVYAEAFRNVINRSIGTEVKGISEEALACLEQFSWPGNVRQLYNVLEQWIFQSGSGRTLEIATLPNQVQPDRDAGSDPEQQSRPLKRILQETERNAIRQALKRFDGNKKRTAENLGIQRSALYLKLKKYDLDRE